MNKIFLITTLLLAHGALAYTDSVEMLRIPGMQTLLCIGPRFSPLRVNLQINSVLRGPELIIETCDVITNSNTEQTQTPLAVTSQDINQAEFEGFGYKVVLNKLDAHADLSVNKQPTYQCGKFYR